MVLTDARRVRIPHAGTLQNAVHFHADPRCRLAVRWCQPNLHIDAESHQEVFKSLATEARELAAHEVGHVGGGNAQCPRGLNLSPTARTNNSSKGDCEVRFGEPFCGVWKAYVGEHVATALLNNHIEMGWFRARLHTSVRGELSV